MPGIPTPEECRRLFRATKLDPRVIAHVEAVAELGVEVGKALQARGHALDLKLLTAGCLLHDVGRARTQGLNHALVGAEILRELGYPERLALCVERHTGGGIDPTDAGKLGLPLKDYNPVTLEEKLVCHVDNLFEEDRRQPVTRELEYLRATKLGHVATKIERLHSEISSLLGQDLDAFGT